MTLARVNQKIREHNKKVEEYLGDLEITKSLLLDELNGKDLESIVQKYDEVQINKRQIKYFVYHHKQYSKYSEGLNRKLSLIEDQLDKLCEKTDFNENDTNNNSFIDQLQDKLDC